MSVNFIASQVGETVTIDRDVYYKLIRGVCELCALEILGVETWVHYYEATALTEKIYAATIEELSNKEETDNG